MCACEAGRASACSIGSRQPFSSLLLHRRRLPPSRSSCSSIARRLIKLPERAATVVIGNPLIADLSVQPGGLAVITGKGYGATNVIVLDHDGAVLTEQTVEVKGPSDPIVVVYRGDKRETYSCTPECARRITLGDDPDYFAKTIDETSTRDSQAIAAGATNSDNRNNEGSTPSSSSSSSPNGVTITVNGGNNRSPESRH